MTRKSHDHNFKNLLQDFPKQTLEWIFPEAIQNWGTVKDIKFVRQEPKKANLTDASLELDMPILFTFEKKQLLLWLVEFQEDKSKFSIYKLSRYTIDYMEAYPDSLVVPTVLFTDRKNWRKDVPRELETKINDKMFLHFEYVFFKLFDFNASDYYHTENPMVRILLPKMSYRPEERVKVIKQAYLGLFQLAPRMLFDKYTDFIDIYAEVTEKERDALYHELEEREETAMLSQYIREKGKQEGVLLGTTQTARSYVFKVLELRFGNIPISLKSKLNKINDTDILDGLMQKAVLTKSFDDFMREC